MRQSEETAKRDEERASGALSMGLLEASDEQNDVPDPVPCVRCQENATQVRVVQLLGAAGEPIRAFVGWCERHYEEARHAIAAIDDPCLVCRNHICDGSMCFDE